MKYDVRFWEMNENLEIKFTFLDFTKDFVKFIVFH